jgi:hypothetical protein
VKDFSIIEQQIDERDKIAIQAAAFGKGLRSLPPDWDKNRAKRIKRASNDFFYGATEYFPRWFDHEFCDAHHRMIDKAMSNDRKIHIFSAERGLGKTRIFRVFKVFCACFGWKHHYSKASDTLDLVLKDFRYVRDIIKYNPKIVSDFGEIIDEKWDSLHSFRVIPHTHNEQGTTFIANSAEKTPRGELGDIRVDFEEFDDFEDFSTSINPDISKAKIDTIERDFQPALDEGGCGVYLGNNMRTTCVINILKEMKTADREARHPIFDLNIIDGWDEKNQRPTWHQRYKAKTEEEYRAIRGMSPSVFKSEIRQQPVPPEGTRFLSKHWLTFDKLPKDSKGIIFCDPAFGETSDFKTFVVLLYSFSMRKFLVPGCFVRRCGWKEYFLAMYDFHNRFESYLSYIGWESNFAQAQWLEFQKIYKETKDLPELPIRRFDVEGDKFFRIEKIETPYSLGNILFAEDFLTTSDGIEAQLQLVGYEGKKNAKHRVDFPDALSSAYKLVWQIAMRGGDSDSPEIEIGGPRRGR